MVFYKVKVLFAFITILCLISCIEALSAKVEVSETADYIIIKHPVYELYWAKRGDGMGYDRAYVGGSKESLIGGGLGLQHHSNYLGGWKSWGNLKEWKIIEQKDDRLIVEYISDDADAKRYICRATYDANVIYVKHEVQIRNRLHKESITAFESSHDPIFHPDTNFAQMIKWNKPIAHVAYWTEAGHFVGLYSTSSGSSFVWDWYAAQPKLPGRMGLNHDNMRQVVPPDGASNWLVYYVAFGIGKAEEAHNLAYTLTGFQPPLKSEIASISGVIRMKTTKQPLAGASVQVWDFKSGEYLGGVTASNSDGRYEIEGLVSSAYRIRADTHRNDVLDTYYSDSIRRDESSAIILNAPKNKEDVDFELQTVQEQGFIQKWLTLGPMKSSSWNEELINVDFLKSIGGEANIAPSEGDSFDYVYGGATRKLYWESRLLNINGNNINEIYSRTNNDSSTAYLVTYLKFSKSGYADLWLGSDDSIAVWINGEQVWIRSWRWALEYDRDRTKVRVNSGWNTLVVKVDNLGGSWGVTVRFPNVRPVEVSTDKPRTTSTTGNANALQILVPETHFAGRSFWVGIQAGDEKNPVSDLFGLSFKLRYSHPELISIVPPASSNVVQGDFMGNDVIFFTNADSSKGEVSVSITRKAGSRGVNGYGTVARINFISKSDIVGEQTIDFTVSDVTAQDSRGSAIQFSEATARMIIKKFGIQVWPGDTDNNGIVDERDVLPIGMYWGKKGPKRENASTNWEGQYAQEWDPLQATYADANGDGVVDERDVLPIGINWHKVHEVPKGAPTLNTALVDHSRYIDAYRQLLFAIEAFSENEPMSKIKKMLRDIIQKSLPQNTIVFQNHPNPFNPETWIPFQLAEGSNIRVTIYDSSGKVVKTMDLGYKEAGLYTDKSKAIYWDGRNESGEDVVSGVYFYHVQAGRFSEIRKMTLLR